MAVAVRREERRSDRTDSRLWPPTTADEHRESSPFAKTEKIQKNRIMTTSMKVDQGTFLVIFEQRRALSNELQSSRCDFKIPGVL